MPSIVDNSEGREGSGRIRSKGGFPVYEESYTYTVLADNRSQTRLEILQTAGLPRVLLTMGPDGASLCRGLDAKRRKENPLIWDVSADFSSEIEEGSDSQSGSGMPGTDPVAWIPVYETKFERLQEVVTKDESGDSIANSAGQAFETGLTVTRHIPVWEFYQFEPATVTDEQIIERNETVNASTFRGRAAKTLLCVVLSSVLGYFYGQRRRLTQYQLKYNVRDWTHKRLDVGTQYKDGASLKTFLDADGQPMLGSLDGSGAKQTAGTAPAVVSFDQFPTNSFSFIRQ